MFSIARPVTGEFVDVTPFDQLFFLCAVGVFQIQVEREFSARTKYHLSSVGAPDGHRVDGGIKRDPLRAAALEIISPYICVPICGIRLVQGHRFSVWSQRYI